MRPYCWLLLSILAIAGCRTSSSETPPIPAGVFARLYAELLVLAADDSTRTLAEAPVGSSADSVLARAGVTREDYMETVRWYNEDVTRWKELLAQVVLILEQRAVRADSLLSGLGRQVEDATPDDSVGRQPPR